MHQTSYGCSRLWLSLIAACAFPVLAAVLPAVATAAELIVVDQDDCPFCERFEREIAPAWPNTDEGRDVPLRRVDLHADWPSDLARVKPATLTPTFILVENGAEIDRLIGYQGDEYFWFLIGEVLDKRSATSDPSDESES